MTNEIVYEAPQAEVLEVEVEKGFAGSGSFGGEGGNNKDWNQQ